MAKYLFPQTISTSPPEGEVNKRISELEDEIKKIKLHLKTNGIHMEQDNKASKQQLQNENSTAICKLPSVDNFARVEFGECRPSGKPIRATTDAEDQAFMAEELEILSSGMPKLGHTPSIKGKTIQTISESLKGRYSLAVEIENFLGISLDGLDHNFVGDTIHMPAAIEAGTRDVLTIAASGYLEGIFSYKLNHLNLQLGIRFLQKDNNYILAALFPAELPSCAMQFSLGWYTSDRKAVYWKKDSISFVLRNNFVHVRLRFFGGAKSVLQIAILNADLKRNPYSKKGGRHTVPTDAAMIDKAAYWNLDGVLGQILQSYGYVMEITNLTGETLQEQDYYLENSSRPFIGPEKVPPFRKELVVVRMDCSGRGKGGMVTYRIGGTDLRLAVVFQLFNCGNRFAVAFLDSRTRADANTMAALTSGNNWRTSPDYKYAQAKDGELVIQLRNILARATITDGMKAVLTVVIKTC